VKAACAADETCEGFVFRIRDGAGLLGRSFKILDGRNSQTTARMGRFARKAPRGVLLYLRRPRTLKLGKLNVVNGEVVPGPVRGKAGQQRPASGGGSGGSFRDTTLYETTIGGGAPSSFAPRWQACLDAGPLGLGGLGPWPGSPPLADPARRRYDPEIKLVRDKGGFVEAYAPGPLDAANGAKSNGAKSNGAWALSGPPPLEAPRGPLRLPGSEGHERVWISLTTLPGRIEQIERTVLSLVGQSVPFDEVVISVPERSEREGVEYPMPSWLQDLVLNRTQPPRVRVRRVLEDYGPATKLIPSVMEAQLDLKGENVLVLVVDDDTLYPPRLLETLLEWHRRLPDAALAFSGWPVTKHFRYPHWSENYLVYGNELLAPHPVSVVRGNCGYLVSTRMFDSSLWEGYQDAPPGAFFMDDVWISGRLAAAKVRRFVVPFDEDQFTMSPDLANVTTLDKVTLSEPPPLAAKLQAQADARKRGGSDPQALSGGGNLEEKVGVKKSGLSEASPPVRPPPGNNRVQANEQALGHFKKHWDVLWDGEHYKITNPGTVGWGWR